MSVVRLNEAREAREEQRHAPKATAGSNRIKLTANKVSGLKGGSKRRWVADTEAPGLYVSVEPLSNPDGSEEERKAVIKAYYVRGRLGVGRKAPRKDIRIGAVSQIRLSDARDTARRWVVLMREGINPRRQQEPDLTRLTVAKLVDAYEKDLIERGVVRVRDVIGSLRRDFNPMFTRDVAEIERVEYLNHIERIKKTVGEPSGEALRRHLSGMLNFGVNAELISSSVMAGYRKPKRTRAERIAKAENLKRQPNLKGAEEFSAFWAATDAAKSGVFRDYLRVLLLCGQRSIELAKMEWRDLDVEQGLWVVRPETRKTGEPFTMPLGPLAYDIISRQMKVSDLVFPGRKNALITAGQSKRLVPIKAAMQASCGRGDVAFHTLRRAYRTQLSEMGVSEPLAEMMTGHKRDDLIGRYDHSDLIEQRRAAQQSYEAWVGEVSSV